MSKIGKRLIIAVVVVAIMVAGRTIVMNNQTAQDWLAEQALARVLGQNNDTYGRHKTRNYRVRNVSYILSYTN